MKRDTAPQYCCPHYHNAGLNPDALAAASRRLAQLPADALPEAIRRLYLATHDPYAACREAEFTGGDFTWPDGEVWPIGQLAHRQMVEAGEIAASRESATDRAARSYRKYGIDSERASRLATQEIAAHTANDGGLSRRRHICVWEPSVGIREGAEFTGEEVVFPDGQRFLVARPVEGEQLANIIRRCQPTDANRQ